MERYNKFMQFFWLIVGIITTLYAIYQFTFAPANAQPNYTLLMFPILAFVLFYIRRRHNRMMQQRKENEE